MIIVVRPIRSAWASGSAFAPSHVVAGLAGEGTTHPVASRSSPSPNGVDELDGSDAAGSGSTRTLVSASARFAQDEGPGEGVDVLDADTRAVRDDLAPGSIRIRAQGNVGCDEDAEIPGTVIGQRHEPSTGSCGRGSEVVH